MMQLDALLSQFAGVISGFDLGDEVGHQSLGFASATPWMRGTSRPDAGASGVDKGGHFNLTLLGQYAANFSAGVNGNGGNVITDPSSMAASGSLPLLAPSRG